jgi:hypothetical protein
MSAAVLRVRDPCRVQTIEDDRKKLNWLFEVFNEHLKLDDWPSRD